MDKGLKSTVGDMKGLTDYRKNLVSEEFKLNAAHLKLYDEKNANVKAEARNEILKREIIKGSFEPAIKSYGQVADKQLQAGEGLNQVASVLTKTGEGLNQVVAAEEAVIQELDKQIRRTADGGDGKPFEIPPGGQVVTIEGMGTFLKIIKDHGSIITWKALKDEEIARIDADTANKQSVTPQAFTEAFSKVISAEQAQNEVRTAINKHLISEMEKENRRALEEGRALDKEYSRNLTDTNENLQERLDTTLKEFASAVERGDQRGQEVAYATIDRLKTLLDAPLPEEGVG